MTINQPSVDTLGNKPEVAVILAELVEVAVEHGSFNAAEDLMMALAFDDTPPRPT